MDNPDQGWLARLRETGSRDGDVRQGHLRKWLAAILMSALADRLTFSAALFKSARCQEPERKSYP